MKETRIGVGFIGAGKANWTHADSLAGLPDVKLVGVADVVEERAKELASLHGMQAFVDYRDLVKQPDLDAVWISTWPSLHLEHTIACLEAGKHVMIEKPIATSLRDADEMIDAASKRRLKLQIGYNKRHAPRFTLIRRFLDDHEIGDLLWCLAYYNGPPGKWAAADWSWDVKISGGVTVENVSHYLDIVRWLSDTPVTKVYGSLDKLVRKDKTIDDSVAVTLHFRKPLIAVVAGGINAPERFPNEKLYLTGTKGGIETIASRARPKGIMTEESIVSLYVNGSPYVRQYNFSSAGYDEQNAYFVKSIREGLEPWPSAEEGRATLEIALAAVISAKNGQPVSLPLKSPIGILDLLPLPWSER